MNKVAEAIYRGIKNATDDSAKKLGMLSVLHSTGAIDAFAMIQKNYPEVLMSVMGYEQVQFLKSITGSPHAGEALAAFMAGQASITKYSVEGLKYLNSVDVNKNS